MSSSKLPAIKQELIPVEEDIQSWWEIPSIAQFISLFRFAFHLPEIEIEELENALLEDGKDEGSVWLRDLIIAFLRGILPGRGVNASNWESKLEKLLGRKWATEGKTNPLATEKFQNLSPRLKAVIIYSLCEFRLDSHGTVDNMKSMDADALRVQSLGSDDNGNLYWYFYGTRLYKEEPSKGRIKDWESEWNKQKEQSFPPVKRGRGRPRKHKPIKSDGESENFEDVDSKKSNGYMNVDEKSRWSVVCNTIEEWVDFAEKFKDSKSKNEIELFQVIQTNFLPTLNEIYQEKEKKLKQKIRELIPHHIVTRRETRKKNMELLHSSNINGYTSDDAHKMHLRKDRAQRLAERNRRASEGAVLRDRRSKRQKYEDEFEHKPELDEYRRAFLPALEGNNMDLQEQMERLISEVKLHKDSWPFLYPVDEAYAPGYYEIITEPVDLSKIENRLFDCYYETIGQLDTDFCKMVSNCHLYNGENSELSIMADTLWKMFRKGLNKIVQNLSSQKPVNKHQSTEKEMEDVAEIHNSPQTETSEFSMKADTKKRKKKSNKFKALEMLAQASEVAVKMPSVGDVLNDTSKSDVEYSAFSNLRIRSIHSHPSSLIKKFASDSSNSSSGEIEENSYNSSSFTHEDISNSEQHDLQAKETSDVSNSNRFYTSNNNNHNYSQNIEKDSSKEFNILSENEEDESNVMSEESMRSESENASYNGSNSYNPKASVDTVDGFDHTITNLLNDCGNDNVSNLISSLIKEPLYTSDVPSVSQGGKSSPPNLDNSPKSDAVKNSRKSPQTSLSGLVGHTVVDTNVPLLPEGMNVQSNLNNSLNGNEITTVDASVLGISSGNKFVKKHSKSPDVPQSNTFFPDNHVAFNYTGENQSSANKFSAHIAEDIPYRSSQSNISKSSYSPTSASTVNQGQAFESALPNQVFEQNKFADNLTQLPQSVNVGPSSSFSSSIQQVNTTVYGGQMVPSTVTNTSHIPLQVPSSYSTPLAEQRVVTQKQERNLFPAMKVNLPPSTGQILVVPGNPGSSAMTFHLYAQPNSDSSSPIQSHVQINANETAPSMEMHRNQEFRTPENEDKAVNYKRKIIEDISQRRIRVPEQQQYTSSEIVPSQNSMPYQPAASMKSYNISNFPNLIRAAAPVSNSNFVHRNSAPYSGGNNKFSIIRSNTPIQNQTAAQNTPFHSRGTNSNGLYLNCNTLPQSGTDMYQTLCPKTVPVLFSGYKPVPSTNVSTMQSNSYGQNSRPVVPKVFVPNNQQQVQISNVQNSYVQSNNVGHSQKDSTNKVYSKGQNYQQNQPKQFNQISGKIMQHTPPPVLQLAAVTQNAQGFAQVTTNHVPQFVNIPTYVLSNQNSLPQSVQPVVNVQNIHPYHLSNPRQTSMNCSGNS